MASYPVHLSVSTALGAAYGAAAVWWWNVDWGQAFLAAGLTALGGILPDLDSDSGLPVRELFGVLAAAAPFFLFRRLRHAQLTPEQMIVLGAAVYFLIRYGMAELFKRYTVHRGMFHSIPAMLIAGLFVYLSFNGSERWFRQFAAGGIMLGFLSHLVLDEIYSVDFMGVAIRLKSSAGSALKLYSSSWVASASAYLYLLGLAFAVLVESDSVP